MKASRREATTPLRDLTFGSADSLGPRSVFRCLRASTRGWWIVTSFSVSALPAQRVRAVLPADSSPKSLLRRRLPPGREAVAASAVRAPLAFERSGKDSPARTEPAVSATDSLGGTRRATGPGGFATRGGARGPAPSDNSRRFLDISLPASRLRRDVHRPVDMHDAAVLLFLVPSRFAQRARSRSAVSTATTPGISTTSPTCSTASKSPVVMSFLMATPSR